MDDLATTIGARARAARKVLGLTQPEVAEIVGVATEVHGRIERGHMQPSVPTLVRLSRALNVTPDVLLGVIDDGGSGDDGGPEPDPEMVRLVALLNRTDKKTRRLVLSLVRAIVRSA